jgi:DNA-binding NarL/FixJ family response regulator
MLVGRRPEMAAIDQLLGDARQGRSAALVLRGEAGVGKSALLDYATQEAKEFHLLRGVGVEGEADLAYAALHQILRPVFDRIPRLPAPQAAALQAAFALTDETVDERFRVSLGVLGLLSEVAEDKPVLCIVDDAQLLDQASADSLLFAARRLQAESVVLLFGARDLTDRSFEARGVDDIRLSGLSSQDARNLASSQLGASASPGVVEWLIDNARGNPLALIELPATLTQQQLAGLDPIVRRIAEPTTVEQVYLDRVRDLPDETRHLLLLAAAEETGARAAIERAATSVGRDITDLQPAETVGLIRVDSERLEFRHPLVRSAVYRSARFTEREDAHRVLAVASDGEGNPDRAAWHRAAATVGADEDVARDLETTAERAKLRSGHAAAASALERAAELSADDQTRGRRLVAAANAAWSAGQPERATSMLDRAAGLVEGTSLRADIAGLRGVIQWRCGSLIDACNTLVAGAALISSIDQPRALEILGDAALAAWDMGDYRRLAEIGDAVAALHVDGEVYTLLRHVLASSIEMSKGNPPGDIAALSADLARAIELEDTRLVVWSAIAAELAGEEALERALIERSETLARATSDVDRLIVVLESTAVQGFLAGDMSVTSEATEGLQLAMEAGLPNAANLNLAALSWIAAVQGHADECRRQAATVIERARPNGQGIALAIAEWAIALLDLGTGHPDEAVARLTNLHGAPSGIGHPFYTLNSAPDLIEACIRAGRRDTAEEGLALLAPDSDAAAWALAYAARCRGMLSEGAVAEAEFEQALQLHDLGTNAFDKARTELVYGEFLRRERRRGDAREQLRKALETFERLRAEPWADRARTELRATGETARKRDPSTFDDLTPQELQIARLVAEGSSNKEVAAQLFLSPRTVEYHLRKVFAKLGIGSRAELIRHGIVRREEPASASLT